MALFECPECGGQVSTTAASCPKCGYRGHRPLPPKWNRGIAAVLSLVIPGAGQMYKGQVFNGFCWLVLTVVGYVFYILPGLILHVLCIAGASMGDPRKGGYA